MKKIIYEKRNDLKMSQNDLAVLMNVSAKTVMQWEDGLSIPNVLLIPKLAKALEISIDELYAQLSDTSHEDKDQLDVKIIKNFIILMTVGCCIYSFSFIFLIDSVATFYKHNIIIAFVTFFLLLFSIGLMIFAFIRYKKAYKKIPFNHLYVKWDIIFNVIPSCLFILTGIFFDGLTNNIHYRFGIINLEGIFWHTLLLIFILKGLNIYNKKKSFYIVFDKKAYLMITFNFLVIIYRHISPLTVWKFIIFLVFYIATILFVALRIKCNRCDN